jgi:exodeoxyribonuclease V beta subunit
LEYEDRCVVVDYKSSKKYVLKHQNQVRHYIKAIANITGRKTNGIVVYLLDDSIKLESI